MVLFIIHGAYLINVNYNLNIGHIMKYSNVLEEVKIEKFKVNVKKYLTVVIKNLMK